MDTFKGSIIGLFYCALLLFHERTAAVVYQAVQTLSKAIQALSKAVLHTDYCFSAVSTDHM